MSSISLQQHLNDGVIFKLNELFGNVLNIDVIKTVAASCKYNLQESSIKLLEISNPSTKSDSETMNMMKSPSINAAIRPNYLNTLNPPPTKKSKKTLDFEEAVNQVNKGYKVLILTRGLPGSGKTFLSKKLIESTIGSDSDIKMHILSTDDYFYQNRQKEYRYDPKKIEEAHNWNQKRTFQNMSRGLSPVIIDNTNCQMWEMKAYASMAVDYGYLLYILEPDTHWCFNDKELSKRNCHNVPRAKIKDMMDRYEKNITPQKLFSAYNLVYKFQRPPQLRLYPPPNVIKQKTTAPVETVDLMGFDDVCNVVKPPQTSANEGRQDSIDRILMVNENNKEDNVMKPTTSLSAISNVDVKSNQTKSKEHDIFVLSTDEEEDNQEDDLYSNFQAWGLNAVAIRSWDIVEPVASLHETNQNSSKNMTESKQIKIETADNSTMTESDYFDLLKNKNLSAGFYGGLRILETVNHDINYSTPIKPPIILQKLMLDKSSMTDDFYEDYANHISELESLFPDIPKNRLSYWYNKCKGDLEWTIEFLLEANDGVESLIDSDNSDDDNNAIGNNKPTAVSENTPQKSSKKSKKNEHPKSSPDDKEEIKKLIESKIDISGEHYSKHLLRIKNFTKNKTDAQPNANEPSTSKSIQLDSDSDDISVDSDFDEAETDNSQDRDNEGTVELNLGEFFVSQLEEKFADPNIRYPKGFLPVVQMPISLAKQLYSFYIESVYQQMENQGNILDTLIKEDEEFARKLQAKEDETFNHVESNDTDLKQIQHDQLAAKKAYANEVEKWKGLNPETLAEKLTKQKLFNIFPNVPQDTLVEILHAHDNKYVDTVEVLMASTDCCIDNGAENYIKEPPIRDEVLEEMKAAQRDNSCKEPEERQEATFYRDEANKYLKKREELYQKAQKYHQKGMTSVAQFYSGLASLQTQNFEKANSMAATAFLDEHSKKLQDFNTLDLHYLYVKEAIEALDVFLDRNINLLRLSTLRQTEYLQIMPGRGNRSKNGKPRLKPAVLDRLRQRNIKFSFLNAGLIRVKITKKSLVTSEL